jgi:flagellar protein FliO/FliZ
MDTVDTWREVPELLRVFFALMFVLGLMGALALIVKKLGLTGAIEQHNRGKQKRLKIAEVLPLDGRRRWVLLQRDDVQHLVILGGNEETVIETGIQPRDNKPHE